MPCCARRSSRSGSADQDAAARSALDSALEARAKAAPNNSGTGDAQGADLMLERRALASLAMSADAGEALEPFERVLTTDLRTSLNNEALASGLIDYARALFTCNRPDDADAALYPGSARSWHPDLVRALRAARSPAAERTGKPGRRDGRWTWRSVSAPSHQRGRPTRPRGGRGRGCARRTGRSRERRWLPPRGGPRAARSTGAHRARAHRGAAYLARAQLQFGGERRGARICAQILGLFEPSIARPPRIAFQSAELRTDELFEIVHAGRNPALAKLLSLTWDHAQAIPQLRRTSETLSLGQQISPADNTPLAHAFARACSLLGREPALLYVKAGAFPEVGVVPTRHPPVPDIVVRSGAGRPPRARVPGRSGAGFHRAAARSLVRPAAERRSRSALAALAAAVMGAFGFTSGARTLTRRQKDLASELWQLIPTRVQSEMRALLERNAAEFDYDALHTRTPNTAQAYAPVC